MKPSWDLRWIHQKINNQLHHIRKRYLNFSYFSYLDFSLEVESVSAWSFVRSFIRSLTEVCLFLVNKTFFFIHFGCGYARGFWIQWKKCSAVSVYSMNENLHILAVEAVNKYMHIYKIYRYIQSISIYEWTEHFAQRVCSFIFYMMFFHSQPVRNGETAKDKKALQEFQPKYFQTSTNPWCGLTSHTHFQCAYYVLLAWLGSEWRIAVKIYQIFTDKR